MGSFTSWWWCSVAQSRPALCLPTDCSTPGFPVLYHLPEIAQTHGHCVGDAIQPSHPPFAFNLSQHQGLFQLVGSSHQVAKGLEFELQLTLKTLSLFKEYSGLISFRIDWLDLLAAQGTFKSSPIPHFKSISSLAFSFPYGPTLTSIHDY